MKKQINIILFLSCLLVSTIHAQDLMNADGTLNTISYSGDYLDVKVPATNNEYLFLSVTGGDGGSRINTAASPTTKVKGGAGVIARGYYKIGSGSNEISSGDILRFIIGRKGDAKNDHEAVGADGGAGSGIFLKKSNSSNWVILMVAGGGGGAFSDCCITTSEGRSANTGTSGLEGGGIWHTGGNGGTNGAKGNETLYAKGGGGKNDAIVNGVPIGSHYVDHNGHEYNFGFGYGGKANGTGAGGGGYSGGGAGAPSASGGGGGSYINYDFDPIGPNLYPNQKTYDPRNGQATYQFTSDIYHTVKSVKDPGKCLDDKYAGGVHTPMQLWPCNGTPAQKWYFDDLRFKLEQNGLCLDLPYGDVTNGNTLQIDNCNSGSNQEWIYDGVSKQIRSVANTGFCVDIGGSGVSGGTPRIQLWQCLGDNNSFQNTQTWDINGTTTASLNNKTGTIRAYRNHEKCIDNTKGGRQNNVIKLYTCFGGANQDWHFDGTKIKLDVDQNYCLDLDNQNTSDGTRIQLYTCNGTNAQNWVYDGATQQIRYAANPHKCFSFSEIANLSVLHIQTCDGSNDNQRFILE